MLTQVDGHSVFYDVFGVGIPVLFVHGGGLDSGSFRPWVDPLATRNRLIFYDQWGLGRSERPDDYAGIDNDVWADELEGLCARLGLGRMILLGHSYGGYIVQEYALKYPERVSGLILANTASALDYAPEVLAAAAARATPDQLAAVTELFHHPGAAEDGVTTLGPQTDDELRELWRRVLPVYSNSFRSADADAFIRDTTFSARGHNHQLDNLLADFDVRPHLSEITVPTLVATGRHDVVTPVKASEIIQAGIAHSQLHIFEDSGHFPFVEQRDEFLRVVGSWLADQEASPTA